MNATELKTDGLLGSRYLSFKRAPLTHTFNAATGKSLCGRISELAACGDPDLYETKATCTLCAKRDPRHK